MTILTEQTAEALIAGRAFTPGPPGFVGAAVDLLTAAPGLPEAVVASLGSRPALRHGFLTARSRRVAVVSGPPSPGLAACLARMADDLALATPRLETDGVTILPIAADAAGQSPPPTTRHDTARAQGRSPLPTTRHDIGDAQGRSPLSPTRRDTGDAASQSQLPAERRDAVGRGAGIRVGLEVGLEGGGPLGLNRRWALAHTLAPVLAAAFANAPSPGWRSVRQAARRDLPVVPVGDPRTAWSSYVMDAPSAAGPTLRTRLRDGARLTPADLDRHVESLRPPVAARGYLELDVADRQPGDGWRIPIAVATMLLDDPRAALEAETATAHLSAEPRLWERAGRDALTDPTLAAAARTCFLAAYAALARQGADRPLRDAVAAFTERYVLRGRAPADDLRDHTTAQA